MNAKRLPPAGRRLAAGLLLVLLAACGRRDEPVQPPPVPPDTTTMGAAPARACTLRADEALQRINSARATGHRCGGRYMPPAPPLGWDQQLYTAAFGHSQDMARRNYFEHRSPEGREVSERVSASRYKWRSVGENLAAGNRSIVDAVDGWLGSPGHCENLMDPKFVDVAVACVAQPQSEWGTYWTMVLARK